MSHFYNIIMFYNSYYRFFGIITNALWLLWQGRQSIRSPWVKAVAVATIAAIAGLLVNATYIDVFEASKVAFTFWAILGTILVVATKSLEQQQLSS